MEKLIIPLLIRMTAEDQAHLEALAQEAQCTVPQLARYWIRRAIHDKLKEAEHTPKS